MRILGIACLVLGCLIDPMMGQTELISVEFNQDDQAGFAIWPSSLTGTSSTATFATDAALTSGTTSVQITTSTTFGLPANRGSSDGNPAGYTFQRLYEDLLIATSPTGFLTLNFSGLNPGQEYKFTLYSWDPGAGDGSNKVWTVTGGTGDPASASVNFQDPLIDNQSFAMVFSIEATASGTFQLRNTAGLSQSAINGFILSAVEVDPNAPPEIVAQPQAVWDGGEELVIGVEVSGPEPTSFQWFLDGAVLPGANSSELTLAAAEWDQDGDYTVRVTNANGFVESDPAAITIDIPEFPTREELTYEPLGPSSRRSGITISEILYHPAQRTDGRELEFIELFNSQPWAEDISGWRLSGEADYVFPEGTMVLGLGFLVVARVPGDVESKLGVTGVLGPWSGNLSNDGGRIRLRKPSDAIVQEVNYNDEFPWPAAADGTGHSLVLARATFGEGDERAWEASHSIGGSPGAVDPVPSDDLDQVFVSAVLSNSEEPEVDFLELRNASPTVVDLSGCLLSDARDTLAMFEVPGGTTIPGGGVIRFDESQLGFALGADGDAVYLTNPGGRRVLDAVILPATSSGDLLVRLRSDGPLRRQAAPTVVINEIMFHPPSEDTADEWIELHNPGMDTVDLSGWAFNDGVDFVFPNGSEITGGGFLVIAKNRSQILANHPDLDGNLVLGSYDGSLSDGGERLALSKVVGGFFVVEDEVTYRDSDRWHRFADGRGSSLERVDPNAASHGPSNWADSDESAKSEWTNVEFSGTLAHGNSAAPANQIQMFLLGAGEALVDQVEVIPEGGSNILSNGGFESGTSGWFFQGNQRRSRLETSEAFAGGNSLRLIASRRGDPGPNRARAPLTQTLGAGSRATLRAKVRWLAGHPEYLLRFRGNWLEAKGRLNVPTNLGTPGAVNSRAVANAGPQIDEVVHRPVLPEAGEEIGVYAEVADQDGLGSVVLRYRIDPSSTTVDLPMNDDGTGADLTAGDGVFSAEIPGQGNGTLIAFQVVAADSAMSESVYPPGGEALIRTGEPANGEAFGTYRMWVTQASLSEWDGQPFRSNDPFPITFVSNGARVVYNAGAYYGGNKDSHGFPTSGSVSYDVALPDHHEFLGADKLTLDYPVRDATNQREQTMHWFADQLKLPTLHRRDVYLYMNGIRRLQIYHDAEQPDGVVAKSHFPGDDGELFKTSNDNETSDSGVRTRPFVRNIIDVFEADGMIREARYRWTTGARARGSRTRLDDTSILELMRRADDTGPDYEERLLEIIDMENWMRTWAMIDLGSFWDAFGNTNYKNSYIYKPSDSGWVQFVWDMDVGLGTDGRDPPNQALFPPNVDANLRRMYENPTFIRAYWRAMDEALGSFYSTAGVTPLLERKRAAYAAAGLSFTSPFVPSGAGRSIPQFIEQRAAFIQPQLDAVNEPFSLAEPADNSSVTEAVIAFSGTAPIDTVAIEVNGIPLQLDWSTPGDWSAVFSLQAGENVLSVRALNSAGIEIASDVRMVTFTGVEAWPRLVINEWMADNEGSFADSADGDFEDWLELANLGPTVADLAGWFLSDDPNDPFKYQIPPGYSILPGDLFLAWADDEVVQNIPGLSAELHLPFKLAAGGESLLLSAPDGTLIDRVDFGRQSPDKTMGLAGDDVVALAQPTPRLLNTIPAVNPTATYVVDGNGLTFTVVTEPGFLYQAEFSSDLQTWAPLSDVVLSNSGTTIFTDTIQVDRRFYRFRRIP